MKVTDVRVHNKAAGITAYITDVSNTYLCARAITGYDITIAPVDFRNDWAIFIPFLYKKDIFGRWMIYSISFEYNIKDSSYILVTRIKTTGLRDRVSRSVVKSVPSKTKEAALLTQVVSKWNKKKDKDRWALSTREEEQEELLNKPTLLKKWEEEKHNWTVGYLASPKLDGIRATYHKEREEIISRSLTVFDIPHILNELKDLGIATDGELYTHGHPLEHINGAVSRGSDEDELGKPLRKEDLHYYIFDRTDLPGGTAALIRYESFTGVDWSKYKYIHLIPQTYIASEEEAKEKFDMYLELDFEGAVFRLLTQLYKWNIRSNELLKWKPVSRGEFMINGVTLDMDATHGPLISFICNVPKVGAFKVTPAWDKVERSEAYKKQIEGKVNYRGQMLTVEYRETTSNGIPKHAVGIVVREGDT